ncbi:Transporter aclS [Colletotrichum fructicola]|uniref:Ncs1 nucleoside transporter family protein n=1 Tax=Colletotrichum fructicola (strain Nara gc5) TaxID=1213859 RepID=L2G170_COLFN|nr:Transporter [Colletotrichum fructicola]KAF4492822.1 Transporter aclS [Colletotrichum fructicola Nara gc5]KAE9569815.1 Transporter [Colletotrichum fructicola]KAF4429520.1 Transporter aclS [Colletotrichum fructicola]KAF4888303.1 Transporter aclS [Colletotrichum fructicola]KAF4903480.1 Transporter aclS [Colletotrichum fructicola]
MTNKTVQRVKEAVILKSDESRHEEVSAWSNRDLIPLPPSRRTWGWFNFFGSWSLSSLNVATWQTPNTFLTQGLSVGQAMAVIVVSRALCCLFAILVAWCGLTWHIGFTVQNRYTWGFRASYIPLMQRILLNFIWNALQCWNGGKLVTVCITAIWPSFAKIPNTLSASTPTTTYELIGFIVFWVVSIPFLFIRPERFKKPFFISSVACGAGMIALLIWSLTVAKGVGPIFYQGQSVSTSSRWSVSWLMMAGINQAIGQKAAGMTNSSDFSRYAKDKNGYIIGTVSVYWITGVLVCLGGLVTTAACQKIYGTIYWNPPDLLMVMMDHGEGSSAARAAVFFLALAFAFTSMFENVCSNAVAGGIDLAGLFPRYIDIRRGALLTFFAAWIIQPWQLINQAATFVAVLNSFAVFLAPIMGVMVCDFFVLRARKVKLSHLFHPQGSDYWYWHGVNWRVIPCWIAGWAPTIGGLIVSAEKDESAPDAVYELYYIAFFVGFFISFVLFYLANLVFPLPNLGEFDEEDKYGTFTAEEAAKLSVVPTDSATATGFGKEEGIDTQVNEISDEGSAGERRWWNFRRR